MSTKKLLVLVFAGIALAMSLVGFAAAESAPMVTVKILANQPGFFAAELLRNGEVYRTTRVGLAREDERYVARVSWTVPANGSYSARLVPEDSRFGVTKASLRGRMTPWLANVGALDLGAVVFEVKDPAVHPMAGNQQMSGTGVRLALGHPSPSPVRSGSTVMLSLPTAGQVRLTLYDASGRAVRTLANHWAEAGPMNVLVDGRNTKGELLPSGVYFYRLQTGGQSLSRRMVISH